jgi:hypothetical protein
MHEPDASRTMLFEQHRTRLVFSNPGVMMSPHNSRQIALQVTTNATMVN